MAHVQTRENLTEVPYSGIGSVIGPEDVEAVKAALEQDDLCSGHYVGRFERAFASYVGVKHAVACSNCTTALELATAALELTDCDEVITTPLTFIATSLPLLKRGVKVVFADIDPRTFNIDPAAIAELITRQTKAIYVVHYGGLSVDMDAIVELACKHGLAVVEDAAHASGAAYKGRMVGSLGDVACFSFQSLKNMTTLGDGGMITTDDDELARKVRLLKGFGIQHMPDRPTKYGHRDRQPPFYWDVVSCGNEVGLNYRMSEVEAAVGMVQLGKLERMTERRTQIAQRLNAAFAGNDALTPPLTPQGYKHAYHLYTLLVDEDIIGSKDTFMELLDKQYGIDTWTQYCPNYLFTIYRQKGYNPGLCPIAEDVFLNQLVNLPIYPAITDTQVDYMAEAVLQVVSELRLRNRP